MKPDVVVFVGPALLAFEQMCGVLRKEGIETHWIGFPFSAPRLLRSKLLTPSHNAHTVDELRAVLQEIGPERIIDVQSSEFVLADVVEATRGLGLDSRLADELERRLRWLDKLDTMEALEAAGVPVPRRSRATTAARAVDEVGLPLVVKGRVANGGVSVRVCHTTDEVEAAFTELAADGGTYAEEFCQGDDGLCYVCCRAEDGTILLDGAYQGIRSQASSSQFGALGPLDMLRTIADPDVIELGRQVAGVTGGHGLMNLDVIRTDRGLRVVDVNQRPWASVVALRSTGADFVGAWLAGQYGREFTPQQVPAGREVRVFAVTALNTALANPLKGLAEMAVDGRQVAAWTGERYVLAEAIRAAAVVARHWARVAARRSDASSPDEAERAATPTATPAPGPSANPAAPEDWIVVGGGATGAAIALRGAQAGHRVTLVDRAPELGGLTATQHLDVDGTDVEVDRFYHVIMESDDKVLALLDELGLKDSVRFTSAPAEIVASQVRYPATTLGQMATLPMLQAVDRARIGASIAASLALPMSLADRITARRWLGATAGRSALDAFWWPMLRAKLGTEAGRVSASFMVSTFRRLVQARLKGAGDRFGVLPTGYAPVFRAMLERVESLGGQVRTGAGVTRVDRAADGVRVTLDDGTVLAGDRVFLTTPGPVTARIVAGLTEAERQQLVAAPYLGVLCGAFLLATPPNDSYITYLVDDVQLTGVIGMHALLPAEQTGGASLVYLPHYCAPDDEWFSLSDEQVRDRMLDGLRRAFGPSYEPDVRAWAVSRAPYVVPLPVPGVGKPLPFATSVPGVHVVSTAQVTTGTLNVQGSLEMVDEALDGLLG